MSASHEALLQRYLRLPGRLDDAIAGLDEAGLDWRSGGWSIRQIVHHLVEGELIWEVNLRAAAGSDGIAFPMGWYFSRSQDEWIEAWAYDRRPVGPALALFRAAVCNLVEFLRVLPAEAWTRSGRVTWPGEQEQSRLSVRDILLIHIRHMDGHSADIRRIRAAHEA